MVVQGSQKWSSLVEVKPMNRIKLFIVSLKEKSAEEDGAVHILLFSLFVIAFIITCIVVTFNLAMQITVTNNTKLALDTATKAAALDIKIEEAIQGRIVWDSTKGVNSFYKFLRLNMNLDNSNNPLENSFLKRQPKIRMLEEVTASSYPENIERKIKLYEGTENEITREIKVTIYGPSVVSIIEVEHPYIGLGRAEPVLVSSVASIRFR